MPEQQSTFQERIAFFSAHLYLRVLPVWRSEDLVSRGSGTRHPVGGVPGSFDPKTYTIGLGPGIEWKEGPSAPYPTKARATDARHPHVGRTPQSGRTLHDGRMPHFCALAGATRRVPHVGALACATGQGTPSALQC